MGKPETFDFLGLTHICGRTRAGDFLLVRHTSRKRMAAKLRTIALTPGPEVGARCGSSARRVLCGGPRATGVPTATASRDLRQHVVGEVGGDLAHAPGVTGRADASALAREGNEPLVAASLTARSSKSVGQNAALQVAPEIPLDPLRQSAARGVGRGRPSQERLEVVLDDLVQGRLSRAPRPVDGAREAAPSGRGGRSRTSSAPLPRRRDRDRHCRGSKRSPAVARVERAAGLQLGVLVRARRRVD